MRFLRPLGLGLVAGWRRRQRLLTIPLGDKSASLSLSCLGYIGAVGAHIGDQAGGALSVQIEALVELLGDAHSFPSGEPQPP